MGACVFGFLVRAPGVDTAAIWRIDVNEPELRAEFGPFAKPAIRTGRVGRRDAVRLGRSRPVNRNIACGGKKP